MGKGKEDGNHNENREWRMDEKVGSRKSKVENGSGARGRVGN